MCRVSNAAGHSSNKGLLPPTLAKCELLFQVCPARRPLDGVKPDPWCEIWKARLHDNNNLCITGIVKCPLDNSNN
jgi:hypothetical protein